MQDLIGELLTACPFEPFSILTVLGDRVDVTSADVIDLRTDSLSLAGVDEPIRYEEIVRLEKLS